MKQFFVLLIVAVFSIFVGSQITEGALMIPYWQSMSSADFYAFYSEWGPFIGNFYTVLTIVALLIPIGVAVYCKASGSKGFKPALISSILAVLFVACFYVYFKGTNALYYQAALSDVELKNELITYAYWHWGRVGIECLSLVFLMLSLSRVRD